MFYLSRQGSISGNGKNEKADEFGWYLEDGEMIEDRIYRDSWSRLNGKNGSRLKRNGKSLKSISIFTFSDEDEKSSNFSVPRESTSEHFTKIENIEMNPLRLGSTSGDESQKKDDSSREIDIEMIEKDADQGIFTSSTRSMENNVNHDESEIEDSRARSRGFSYTPERLVRSQEYRILTPSPRYLTVPRRTPDETDDSSKSNCCGHRRKIGDLIDSKQLGANHLEALLDQGAPEIRLPISNRQKSIRYRLELKRNQEAESSSEFYEPLEIANRESPLAYETPDLVSSRSSYEKLNGSWDDTKSKIVRESSQDDTSGIHSNDWSTDTPSDTATPVCLCDELATASRSNANFETKNRCAAINEVVSILEGLEIDPNRATELLEEDRFCEVTSGHDNLTRLALTIEPDGVVPSVHEDPESLVLEIREKIERLQETSRSILKDIDNLRRDFECNETKVDNLIEATVTLRHDRNEVRYLDDLLNLLDGELERISKRNWPFVFGHSELHAEEMNLVV